jgi:hypothetical protein
MFSTLHPQSAEGEGYPMVAVLLSALFAGSGMIAAATISASWRRYGAAARALPAQLNACEDWREVRVRISEVNVRHSATVLRPDFTAAPQDRLDQSSRPAVLPAAA